MPEKIQNIAGVEKNISQSETERREITIHYRESITQVTPGTLHLQIDPLKNAAGKRDGRVLLKLKNEAKKTQ